MLVILFLKGGLTLSLLYRFFYIKEKLLFYFLFVFGRGFANAPFMVDFSRLTRVKLFNGEMSWHQKTAAIFFRFPQGVKNWVVYQLVTSVR